MENRFNTYKMLAKVFTSFFISILPLLLNAQTSEWRLIWDKNSEDDMAYYSIYRSHANQPYEKIGQVDHPDTVYSDITIIPGTLYSYRISAINYSLLESEYSDIVSAAIPDVIEMPHKEIREGEQFNTIALDEVVYDPDHPDEQISWNISGQTDLIITTNTERITTITVPDSNWFGQELLIFRATDPDSFFDIRQVRFTVNSINDAPQILGLPESITFRSDSAATIDLTSRAQDIDSPDSLLQWTFSVSNHALLPAYNENTQILQLTAPGFEGTATLYVTLEDDKGASDSDSVRVVVENLNALSDEDYLLPKMYKLYHNFPNPFNSSTIIRYDIPKPTIVFIELYNGQGQKIKTLLKDYKNPGRYQLELHEDNLASGIYYYRISADNYRNVKRMLLIK